MAQSLSSLTNTIAVDGTGKLPSTLMPDSVVGALNYQGTWNAATNIPHIQNGTGTKGHYYKVATQGTTDIGGINFWNLGDVISYNGTTWDRIDGGINEVVTGPQGPVGPPGPTGQPGNDGLAGPPGADGQTLYSWFAYANDATGSTNFTTGTWTNQTYLGIAVNKTTPVESTNPADYSWSKMQGPPGAQGTTGADGAAGPQGNSLYTWIVYADDATGSTNFTTGVANGRLYIGIANNKTSPIESTNPSDYVWSKIAGEDGVPGTPGADGQTTYTWFAYANSADGTQGFTTGAWTNQTYLGLAANKLTSVESQNPADYFWSKIQGPTGDPGVNGVDGSRGASKFYAFGSAWTDTAANNAVLALFPAGKVINDEVTISNGSTYAMTKYWNGSAWVAPGTVIDGNLLVSGSVSAAKINTNGLTIRDPSGTIVLDASGGAALDWAKIDGAGRPQDGATVGATFGSNIWGQITSGNVSTYIASAAITDAYIGNLSANKITAGTLNASSYVQVDAGGGNTTRMGLLPDSSFGIRGTYNGNENFKLSAAGLSFNPTNETLWKLTGSNIKKTVAEGRVILTGVVNNTVITQSILIPNAANTVYTKVIEVQVVGYWENAAVTSTRTFHKKLYIQLAYKNSTAEVLKYDAGVYMCEHSDSTNWPVYTGTDSNLYAYNGAAYFYYDQVNEELYLNLKSPASNDIGDESFFSYSIQEYEGKPIVSNWG